MPGLRASLVSAHASAISGGAEQARAAVAASANDAFGDEARPRLDSL